MSVTLGTASIVAAPGQQINLGALVSVTAGADPQYLVVSGLDRSEYTASNNGQMGTVSGNGQSLGFSNLGSDSNTFGIVYTYNAATGQYVNATYGALNSDVLTASGNTGENEALSIFTSNDAAIVDDANNPYALSTLADATYAGTVSVVTQPGFTGPVPDQATPDSICAAAGRFVGQAWNDSGCWVLASNISAEAGASLPITSTSVGVAGVASGEWIVAYDGPAGDTGNWQSMVKAGEMVVFQDSPTSGHITTVVSGSGSTAELIDNITYVNADGSIFNSANDGSANDVIIEAPHLASAEFANAVAGSAVIYELDTPTLTASSASINVTEGGTKAVAGLFTASNPVATQTITSYQVYDTATQDTFLLNGVATAAHSAANALTESATSLASLVLQAGTSVLTDTLDVRAFNGSYWGDWSAIAVDVTPPVVSAASAAIAVSQNTLSVVSVADTAAGIAANLAPLETLSASGDLASIQLTDPTTPVLALSAAQYSADSAVLADITSAYILDVTASAAAATIVGGAYANELSAGTQGGNHLLKAGTGTGGDSLYGGLGADTLDGSTAAAHAALLVAGTGKNLLFGGLGYDTLVGGGQSELVAGAGHQELLGGYSLSAHDTLYGSASGYDFMAVHEGNNLLSAGTGTGNFLMGGLGADTLTGSATPAGADVLVAGSGANILDGGLGADTLVGGGDSVLNAGQFSSHQLLIGGFSAGAHDTLNAAGANTVLGVAQGNNVLNAGTGTATLFGGAGNDLLKGGGGNSVLVGGTGASTLKAGSGSDTLIGGGDSLLIGGTGAKGTSVLLGGYGVGAHDTLMAGTGSNETLAVVQGNNQLFADTAGTGTNDVLYAGIGNDTLYGAGYGSSAGANTTTNYVVGTGNSTVLAGNGNNYVTIENGTGTTSIQGGSGTTYANFAGHDAADATITTAANGTTTIAFAGSTQTATLNHVQGIIFEGSSAIHTLG